ncbi:conjugal transfer protein TraD [Orientia tsutsugamushi]
MLFIFFLILIWRIKRHIRLHGLKWNSFRQEWCGHVKDIESLKNGLLNVRYSIELIV